MFTDIHHHLIWGVDDGAETREETFAMVDEAVKDGVGILFSTPHITPGEEPFPMERYLDHFQQTKAYIQEKEYNLELYTGHEVLYTPHTARMLREKQVLPLGNSDRVLIEFVPDDSYERMLDAAMKVRQAGFTPIFAHVERYGALRKTEQVRTLKEEYGVEIQVNARSLLRKTPLLRRRFFTGLFKENLVDYVASDTHAMPGRSICMREGFETLKTLVGEGNAILLCGEQGKNNLC